MGRKASPVSTRAEGSDAICVKSNIVQNHAKTVGITFSSYTKSLFQTRSTLLARTKSYRLLARGRAQTCVEPAVATHAQITLCIPGGASCTAHKLCELSIAIFGYLHRHRFVHSSSTVTATGAGERGVGSSSRAPRLWSAGRSDWPFLVDLLAKPSNRASILRGGERQRVSVGGTKLDRGGLREVEGEG